MSIICKYGPTRLSILHHCAATACGFFQFCDHARPFPALGFQFKCALLREMSSQTPHLKLTSAFSFTIPLYLLTILITTCKYFIYLLIDYLCNINSFFSQGFYLSYSHLYLEGLPQCWAHIMWMNSFVAKSSENSVFNLFHCLAVPTMLGCSHFGTPFSFSFWFVALLLSSLISCSQCSLQASLPLCTCWMLVFCRFHLESSLLYSAYPFSGSSCALPVD